MPSTTTSIAARSRDRPWSTARSYGGRETGDFADSTVVELVQAGRTSPNPKGTAMNLDFNDTQDVNASAATLLEVLTDYASYPSFNRAIDTVTVVRKDDDGAEFVAERSRRHGRQIRAYDRYDNARDLRIERTYEDRPATSTTWTIHAIDADHAMLSIKGQQEIDPLRSRLWRRSVQRTFSALNLTPFIVEAERRAGTVTQTRRHRRSWKKPLAIAGATLGLLVGLALVTVHFVKGSVLRGFTNGELEAADYWRDEPQILAGGFGFDNIIGVPQIDEATVRGAGGSWYGSLECTSGEQPDPGLRTSVAEAESIPQGYRGYADYDDGLPIEFSWPVATETVDPSDFQFTLNTGEIVFGHAAGMNPNWELNERNTVVLFGDFGNRKPSSDPAAIFPVRLEIVEDETPLQLIAPDGHATSAVGLTWTTDKSPYDRGPSLVGAKLNAIDPDRTGEGGVTLPERAAFMPNDEVSLYGDEGDFRLRVLTTGGFSPDGVTGLRPDMYEDFFRLHVRGRDGETVLITDTDVDYEVAGGSLRVLGLSDLGRAADPDAGVYYDDCYEEDRDNYIDIILAGDEAAARSIENVEIPSLEGGYRAFYNPGGPGPEPFDGVTYTAPGPADLEPVTIALDDPMRISRDAQSFEPTYWMILVIYTAVTGLGVGVLVFIRRRTRTQLMR
jgi:hypothetical protein